MILNYQLTVDDLFALQKNYFRTSKYHINRGKLAFIVLLLFSYLTFNSLLLKILPGNVSPDLIGPVSIGGGILLVLILLPFVRDLYFKLQVWRFKIAFKRLKNNGWPKECITKLTPEGIELHIHNSQLEGKTQLNWSAFQKVGEDEQRFFLYHTDMDAVVLPKQIDSSNEESRKALRVLLTRQLGHLLNSNSKKKANV
ncbi:YcxB family protein [Planococcus sp. A6]|uniref:YcxB family protein n=1 Tax=Planococcus sp. A6 TaxID=2992760 RepID=UPI00237A09F8|nr:YcxB family protein [Planococcus sp. A6]MDE0581698.1 YcxB family protein [Planococcus sp. A6]